MTETGQEKRQWTQETQDTNDTTDTTDTTDVVDTTGPVGTMDTAIMLDTEIQCIYKIDIADTVDTRK